jgi:hypothetical protein
VSAPGGSIESEHDSQHGSVTIHGAVASYTVRGCDDAAQTIQNLTSRDFGHRVSDSISQRDKAIKAWWAASHAAPQRRVTSVAGFPGSD